MLLRMIDHANLLELISYDPETGLLRSKVDTQRRKTGDVLNRDFLEKQRSGVKIKATSVFINGYGSFRAGRLAWFYVTGKWPDVEIDHEDNDGWNQKWENLRLATRSQNQANTRCYQSNQLGQKGVYVWRNRYRAMIQKDGRRISLGSFGTQAEARGAYAAAAAKLHGEFARAA